MAMNAGLAAYIANKKKHAGSKSAIQSAAAKRLADSTKVNGDNLVPTGKAPTHMPPWLVSTSAASVAKKPKPGTIRGGGPGANTPPWLNQNSKGN